ncbi:MAG: FG-GAP repeat protein [Verrucomicrobiales bacterium]|nr:FG-GAP repeat protein [Verrucomicrobiales bacterium]
MIDLGRALAGASARLEDYVRVERADGVVVLAVDAEGRGVAYNDFRVSLAGVAAGDADLHRWVAEGNLVTGSRQLRPRVELVASQPQASEEGPVEGAFRLTRLGSLEGALTVRLATSGSAVNGLDDARLAETATFAPGERELFIAVRPFADNQAEPVESVEMTVLPGEGYEVAAGAQGSRVQVADLPVVIALETLEPVATVEPPLPGVLLVRRSAVLDRSVLVRLEIGGSAAAGVDYLGLPRFVGVGITEVDDQGQETLVVRVLVDDPDAGAFTSLGGFVETPAGSGLDQFTGTAAAATTALHGLGFVPIENYFTVPTTQPVAFTLTVEDPYITQPVAASRVVNVQTVNDPPVIAGTVAGQEVYYLGTIRPFASTTISEVDARTLQPLVVTVAFDASRGVLVNPNGFTPQSLGQFRYDGTAAQATAALRGVVFAPQTANRLVVDLTPPPGTEETHFTLTVEDGFAPPVVDATTSVIAVHSLIRKGVASDAASGDLLGYAVAASRDLIALGTPGQDDFGSDSGSVYVRARNQGGFEQWGTVTQLYASDPAANARFGHAVALSGNLLAVGAPQARVGSTQSGTVYVFEPSAPGATDGQAGVVRLTPFDGANGDEFGYAVALSGDTLAVGARSDDDRGSNCGAVYVYRRVARGNWTLLTPKLVPADLAAGDQFGHAVGLHANTLVVGSPLDDDHGTDSGSA